MSCRDIIIQALPGTQAEVAQCVQRSRRTVCVELGALVTVGREAHIGEWLTQPRGGKPIAVYVAGPGPNAPRPPLTRGALYTKRSRMRDALAPTSYGARA
ncbi:hypothetical protein [Variovorax sp. EBFNA2]|uniref:hypothetical protein n=1 Tax=Variovorax sp. EBFNA2 TaxID=3342097 RepID=UPI0029C015E7|nr:hypothetical protein [Variovorax boronicumulans]WPG35356.1 hypothetical protein RZE79_17875 [Variovorax boronicumulans]